MALHRFRSIPGALFAGILCFSLGGCGDGGPAANPRSGKGVQSGAQAGSQPSTVRAKTKPLTAERRAELEAELDLKRRNADGDCRKLLASFQARAYDPVRDSSLEFLQGTVDVRVLHSDGAQQSGRYVVAFNAENRTTQQTVCVRDEGAESLPANSDALVQRLVSTGFRGGFYYVVNYLPNILLVLMKTRADKWGVHCPPIADVGVSYGFDAENMIVSRGTTRTGSRSVERYTWENPQGRHLLLSAQVEGTATKTTWTWGDSQEGVYLPRLIRVDRGQAFVELRFTYSEVRVSGTPTVAKPK